MGEAASDGNPAMVQRVFQHVSGSSFPVQQSAKMDRSKKQREGVVSMIVH